MYRTIGNLVVRFWPLILLFWVGVVIAAQVSAPPFRSVVQDGEFVFLPEDSPSLQAEALFKQAWNEPVASRCVIVVRRESREEGLLDLDREFIEKTLKPAIEQIAIDDGGLADAHPNDDSPPANPPAVSPRPPGAPVGRSIIGRVRTFSDRSIGRLLNSDENKATLVVVELTTEFLDASNGFTIDRIEGLFTKDDQFLDMLERNYPGSKKRNEEFRKQIPAGLALATSGDATVGRDMLRAASHSASATERWTIILVVLLLIAIYRAPGLALIPLLTVGIATELTLALLAHMAQAGIVGLFEGIQVYVRVLSYGAGVDYCLFLIARYKEELDEGHSYRDAVGIAISRVGATLTASAFTVICGIGMMRVAHFGKFQEAGIAIAFGLVIVLCTSLTFTPALLRLAGRYAFWPKVPNQRLTATVGWLSATSLVGRIIEKNHFQAGWKRMGQLLQKKPGTIWLASLAVMAPFAVVGVSFHNWLSYGLLTELPQDKASVVGAKAVQAHFPAGIAGPVTVLLKHPTADFGSDQGIAAIEQVTQHLVERRHELKLSDIRSVARPLGILGAGNEPETAALTVREKLEERVRRERSKQLSRQFYVSHEGELEGRVTRMEFVFQDDPFSPDGMQQLARLEQALQKAFIELPAPVAAAATNGHSGMDGSTGVDVSDAAPAGQAQLPVAAAPPDLSRAEVFVIGATASIRDLKFVTDGDQIRIDVAVILSVFLVLVLLLRRPAISLYLILSVFFSYLVTLGVTFVVFWSLDGADFAGLDWKVPIFLFCILIAVGEDYNIFLMTRIDEEQQSHGPIDGVTVALQKTGSIISSCGIIMAGTFSSLLFGSLAGMHQLGFALAFGVLLDTFVVRPILVPAYLILLHRGQLGIVGKMHEADDFLQKKPAARVEVTSER